jgi:hypothetical protein
MSVVNERCGKILSSVMLSIRPMIGLAEAELPSRTMMASSANHFQRFLDAAQTSSDSEALTSVEIAALLKTYSDTESVRLLLAEMSATLEDLERIPAHW